jgi:uncharacterized protein (TIGR02099 family)
MSLFRRSIHIASKQVYYLMVALLVLTLMVAGSLIWLSDAIEKRNDEVEAWASKQLGYPIEIGNTELYWLDLVPKLHVHNMHVLQQDQVSSLLDLEHIYLALDLWASFQQGQVVLKNPKLTGLTIGLTRMETGKFQLTGLAESDITSDFSLPWYKWFSLLKRFDLDAISVNYTDMLNANLSGKYQITNAIVSHEKDNWKTTTKIQLPDAFGQSIAFNGDLYWSAQDSQIEAWNWQLVTKEIVLGSLLKRAEFSGLAIEDGLASFNIKAQGIKYKVSRVEAVVDISRSKLVSTDENNNNGVLIEQLNGQFSWQQDDKGWQLSGQDVLLDINDEKWPLTNFNLKRDAAGTLAAETSYLRLSDLSAFALLTKALPDSLRHQKPAGDMTSVQLEYDLATNEIKTMSASLKDFTILPWQNVPGVTGLTASVDWHENIAEVVLDSHQLTLYPEKWLKDAVFFDSLSGQLRWQKGENWQVTLSDLQLWNDDLTLQVDGDIKQESGTKSADLTIKLEQVELKHWQKYVSQTILDDNFKLWSKAAFVAGKVIDGDIRLKGNLADFPFDKKTQQGQFDMKLNVADVQLHYASDWPDLMALTGMIIGKNNQLDIHSEKGKIAGFNIAEVDTKIQNYIQGESLLTVDALLAGTTQQALDFLQNSPLKERFGSVADVMTAKGNSDIKLALNVPLYKPENSQASGYIRFKQSQLFNPEFPKFNLSEVEGKLQFNNDGVLGEGIKAKLLQQAVMINIAPENDETVIDVKGEIAVENVNKTWPNTLPEYISGQTNYQAKLSVYEKTLGEFELDVVINSDLTGIGIDMPAPFGKKSEQQLTTNVSIEHLGEDLVYSAAYGDSINAKVLPAAKGKWRGEIRFGQGKAILPNLGMVVKGQLDEISIDDWLSWQEKLPEGNEESLVDYIDLISMNIGHIDAYQQTINGLAFTAERAAQDWRISLHSDQVKGNINWPHNFASDAVLIMDFDHVYLNTIKDETAEQDQAAENVNLVQTKPLTTLWPSINFHTKKIHIDEMTLGELNLQASRHEKSWVIDAAILKSDTINASVKGQWQQLERGDESHFKINASSDDFRGLLADLGYQQVAEAERVDIRVDLRWPNSPLDFSREESIGQLTLDVGKGRLIEVEPGAAGRIFGLLSVATIPRRLALDFTDLFGKGFNFDVIKGSFGIEHGTAYTDDLLMKGQSATIDVVGSVNVVDKTYDQIIKITPNVSATLPFAGAVAGGPIGLAVGTGILIFDKIAGELFGQEIVNLISYSYKLKGPWDDPQLNFVKPLSN